MHNRAEIVDQNFKTFVAKGNLPTSSVSLRLSDVDVSKEKIIEIFESQMMSRILDIKTRELRVDLHTFYTIGSSGHEGNAAIGHVTRVTDRAFLHYRNAPFMIQRSKEIPGQSILHDMLLSFVASSEDPISGGRHKVLGSVDLNIPPQTSTIASHLPKAVGAALSISRNYDLGLETKIPKDSIVVCSFGDASANHASSQSAFNTADLVSYQNIPLPLLFVCEDNGLGISVKTPDGWIRSLMNERPSIKYFYCDGLNLLDTLKVSAEAAAYVRKMKKPAFLHVRTVRLLGHAGSDIEVNYRKQKDIDATEFQDPLLHTARIVLENSLMTKDEVLGLYDEVRERIDRISEDVIKRPRLKSAKEIMQPIVPPKTDRPLPPIPSEEERQKVFGREWKKLGDKWQMNKLINFTLKDLMLRYPQTLLFGEDVAQKGGVYNVTNGLSKSFGQKRVFNSPLDETSILGTAIGFASNGFIPMPEIQFLAYVHNAEDQIRGEASTLSFFSNGQYTNPMVIRIAGLAYQKGFGGHFHNDNSLTLFRDLPGVILACPSNGVDAAMMLRTCVREAYQNGRVIIFIEPIALYKTKDLFEEGDNYWASAYPKDTSLEIPLGEFNIVGAKEDHDVCIVTYANGFYLSNQARKELEQKYGIKVKIIDLRWLAPLNEEDLCKELDKSKHVLVVDECRKSGSISEALVTAMVEKCESMPKVRRLCAQDSFIPLGDAANLVLPQKEDIVRETLILLGRENE